MAQKYLITASRFFSHNGQFVYASIEQPAVIELPEGVSPDRTLIPCDEAGRPIGYKKPRPHYADKQGGAVPTGAQTFSAPVEPPMATNAVTVADVQEQATEQKPGMPAKSNKAGQTNKASPL